MYTSTTIATTEECIEPKANVVLLKSEAVSSHENYIQSATNNHQAVEPPRKLQQSHEDAMVLTGKIIATEVAAKNHQNDENSSKNSSERSSPVEAANGAKVELRMDEITSKFKSAFERMAELESLQLSMENDTVPEEDIKRKWLENHYKSGIIPGIEDMSRNGTKTILTAKEERLSPGLVPLHAKEHENDFDGRNNNSASENSLPAEWSYEEQFKKLYELGDEADRKDFLDKLFAFMQQRGTPVNRVPIMAKQTLDLYQLYKLVVERGGLVEVINKKIWRGIIKGLNLPSSVTSAAFTLRTQYMKYIYPYECYTLKLSSPSELQSAIDGNRRDTTRRPSIGHYTSMVEPEVGFYSDSTSPKSTCSSPPLKRAASPTLLQPMPMRVAGQSEFVSPSFHGNNGIGFSSALQRIVPPPPSPQDGRAFKYDLHSHVKSPSYGHLERMPYEPPPCKKSPTAEDMDKQLSYSHAPWANIKIRTASRVCSDVHENGDPRSPSCHAPDDNPTTSSSGKLPKQLPAGSFEQINENSMVVSIELNGIRYQGVLYAQRR